MVITSENRSLATADLGALENEQYKIRQLAEQLLTNNLSDQEEIYSKAEKEHRVSRVKLNAIKNKLIRDKEQSEIKQTHSLLNNVEIRFQFLFDRAFAEYQSLSRLDLHKVKKIEAVFTRLMEQKPEGIQDVDKLRGHRLRNFIGHWEAVSKLLDGFEVSLVPEMSEEERWKIAVIISLSQVLFHINLWLVADSPKEKSKPEEILGKNCDQWYIYFAREAVVLFSILKKDKSKSILLVNEPDDYCTACVLKFEGQDYGPHCHTGGNAEDPFIIDEFMKSRQKKLELKRRKEFLKIVGGEPEPNLEIIAQYVYEILKECLSVNNLPTSTDDAIEMLSIISDISYEIGWYQHQIKEMHPEKYSEFTDLLLKLFFEEYPILKSFDVFTKIIHKSFLNPKGFKDDLDLNAKIDAYSSELNDADSQSGETVSVAALYDLQFLRELRTSFRDSWMD
jgi:hypothetical protein